MAVTATPIFRQAEKVGVAQIATANTNRDGSGTVGTVFTSGSNGSQIDHIDIKAAGNTTAGMVRLFIYDGTNYRLWKEIDVTAATPSGTVKAFSTTIDCSKRENNLFLQSGYSLRATTHNAETFNVHAFGGDY